MQDYSPYKDRDRILEGCLTTGTQLHHSGLRRILVVEARQLRRVVEHPLRRLGNISFVVQLFHVSPSCYSREEEWAGAERLAMCHTPTCYCA